MEIFIQGGGRKGRSGYKMRKSSKIKTEPVRISFFTLPETPLAAARNYRKGNTTGRPGSGQQFEGHVDIGHVFVSTLRD